MNRDRRNLRPKKLGIRNSVPQPPVDDPNFQPAIEGLAKDEQALLINAVRVAPDDLFIQVIQNAPRELLVQIIGKTPVRGSMDTIISFTDRLKVIQEKLGAGLKNLEHKEM
jgi:hypothetical protein